MFNNYLNKCLLEYFCYAKYELLYLLYIYMLINNINKFLSKYKKNI